MDRDCDTCGALAVHKCQRCGEYFCDICIDLPCEDMHIDVS